jgi:hypothetical protein
MFTLRFIKHGGRGHKAFTAASYEVDIQDNFVEVAMTTGSEVVYEQIGPTQPYDVAYVTNVSGRTVDKITV